MASTKTFYDVVRSAPRGRFTGVRRNYTPEDVLRLRGSINIEHTMATMGANKLWRLLHEDPYVNALGAVTGNQAMQMVRAGLKAIYLSGWQVAADNNTSGSMYPDQSLYPSNSGPDLVKRINKTLCRADQVDCSEGIHQTDWFAPIVADAEAGFGGALNCFEIMKAYVESGAAGVHYEDQLSSEKKCGHLGGKVLLPTSAHERNVNAARLAADVCGVPTVLVSRTDAESATLITSAVDERDRPFIDFDRGQTPEGFYYLKPKLGLEHCIRRGIAYAPYSDMLWMETSTPDLEIAKAFAEGVKKEYPDILLSYNCSPSFNWEANLAPAEIERFQVEMGAMGYRFQFVTLAGFHSLNLGMYKLARGYKESGMAAYSALQQEEFALQRHGYTAVRHQREVGTKYFDRVALAASGGSVSTTAADGSTEAAQFKPGPLPQSGARTVQQQGVRIPQAGLATAATVSSPTGGDRSAALRILAPSCTGENEVLSDRLLQLVSQLHTKFDNRRRHLLEERNVVQEQIDGGHFPSFRKETADIRKDDSWQASEIPKDLQDRRVEITCPATEPALSTGIGSGANGVLVDFEDSLVPTWRNLIGGQKLLKKIIGQRRSHATLPALICRPRGLHLVEGHVQATDGPVSASIWDLSVYLQNNAKQLLSQDSGPYLYLPKIQNFHEAELWNDLLAEIEAELDLPTASIKATVLIEHILATFDAEEILFALKDRVVGLNCGRWDYLFSHIKTFNRHPQLVMPDRATVTMQSPFMGHYAQSIINVAHARGVHAMGSMSPQVPDGFNQVERSATMEKVRADKEREFGLGHDGTWVAHPSLVPVAASAFGKMPAPGNQIAQSKRGTTKAATKPLELIQVPFGGTLSDACLRQNIRTTLTYYTSWLQGKGWVPLNGLMEEAATAEVSRAQVWQWCQNEVTLNEGTRVTAGLVDDVIEKEARDLAVKAAGGRGADALQTAKELLINDVHSKDMRPFMTEDAYNCLIHKDM
jgi:isocitrate lyase